jgi:4-amino-4-deoxy-L-arabinose transferase-like glycosyltransferase
MGRNRTALIAAAGTGAIALLVLGLQIAADPFPGVTFSQSPYSDEAWSVLGARNLVLLGTWAPDELQMYLVQLPFNATLAAVFELFGVGIIQARVTAIVLSVATVMLGSGITTRHFGPIVGVVAGIGLATTPLFLYYGRMAYLEPMVAFFLLAGLTALLAFAGRSSPLSGLAAGACLALAIGTKPSAAAAALGILVAAFIVGGDASLHARRRAMTAAGVIVLTGVAWIGLVWLPNRDGVEAALRFWPQILLPATAWDAVLHAGSYLRVSDGAIPLTLPLLVAAASGAVVAAARWRSMARAQRLLVAFALGWLVFGGLVIVLSSYRPNRYVVPLLPPLAILAGVAGSALIERVPKWRALRIGATAGLAVLLMAPGVIGLARWIAAARRCAGRSGGAAR